MRKLYSQQEFDSYKTRIAKIPEEFIAWFSGWLCGDGCIQTNNGYLTICFNISDKDPLEKMAVAFGNGVKGPYGPYGIGKKALYHWNIHTWRAALILRRCLPWLSIRYRLRAQKRLEFGKFTTFSGRKLTLNAVRAIKTALAAGTHGTGRRLAKKFNVSESLISTIKKGQLHA